jgi:hypothetical protein
MPSFLINHHNTKLIAVVNYFPSADKDDERGAGDDDADDPLRRQLVRLMRSFQPA